ncbi:MAG: ketoacyl-ACP synthase III [Candidatus Aminicenantes bacterium]|nr:ketoacyl-ACP synthase III [Candidatus Aminicenantes bacterium]
MRVMIAGTGKCLPGKDVPGRIVTNDEIVRLLLAHKAIKPGSDRPWLPEELTPQRIVDLVGIRERRWVDDSVNTSDLALVAAERALADAGIGWKDLGIVALGSSTPEAIFPSTACMVLNKAVQKGTASGEWEAKDAKTVIRIPAFDLLAACTSSLYAVDLVRKHLLFEETEAEYGLAMGSEVLSRILDFSDTNADLWGDAAAAVVLKRTAGTSGIICSETGTDSWGVEAAYSVGKDTRYHESPVKPNIAIRGHDIQKFVLKIIPELVARTIDKANRVPGKTRDVALSDVDLFICHQANARIFEFPAKKLGIPVDKFYVNVDRRGNCSSASVLMALREAVEEGRVKKGDLIMLLSFGGGLTWASMLVEW